MSKILSGRLGSAGSVIYHTMKQQILSLELPPGTALSEKEMSLTFQVSRTPVRESFVRLAQEGLVVVLPQRGTLVSFIDPKLVEEAQFMRETLEQAVIRLACQQFPPDILNEMQSNLNEQETCMQQHDGIRMLELDEAFHALLFEGCGKRGTWGAIQQVNTHLNRSRMLWLKSDPHWGHLVQQHQEMIAAIDTHDEDKAQQVMHEHLSLGSANLAALRTQYKDYFL